MTRAYVDLLEMAERYGDAIVDLERQIRDWSYGQPTPKLNPGFQQDLLSAARAYATSTRRKRKRLTAD